MSGETQHFIDSLNAAADLTRLRLLSLCRQGECSVSELTGVLGQSQPRISQQLKVLSSAGMLQRFRDGQRVFYRWPPGGAAATRVRALLALLPGDEQQFAEDVERLRQLRGLRGTHGAADPSADDLERPLHRAVLDLTVTQAVGDLLDIGCGRGRLLKLLASRANRAVGVDIDATARDLARGELLLAGLENCSLRNGDMYCLPFAADEFDTIILDEVLAGAAHPVEVLLEAQRVLRAGGRLLILQSVVSGDLPDLQQRLAAWSSDAGLRMRPARLAPNRDPMWLLAEARPARPASAAA